NIAAGRGANFRYAGPGTGTSQMPLTLKDLAGNVDPSVVANYADSNFASSTFVNLLPIYGPSPITSASTFRNTATFRSNAAAAGLPLNFFRVNGGKLGGAFTIENNGRTYYDAGVVELRRRLSKGLLVQGSYTLAKSTTNIPVSSSSVFYQPRSLRN